MENFIGLDAHSKSCTFVVVDKNGQMISRCKVDTTEKNLLSAVRSVQGNKKLVYEETNLSHWLYLLLKNEVDELIVCNPGYLGKKQGAKTDFRDALHLANELRCNHIVPVFHKDNSLINMRVLVSSYEDHVRDCTRMKNRLKAIFRSQGIVGSNKEIYSGTDLLEKLHTDEDKFVVKHLVEQISNMEKLKVAYKNYYAEYKKKEIVVKNLCTIPGIDVVRSTTIASYICSPERFINKHKLWSYAMLVKHKEISDDIVYCSKTKYGRTELKSCFIGAAESNLRTNSGLKKYYDQLRSKGVDHYKARKAIARKIAAIALHIIKKGDTYDDKLIEKQKRKQRH